ncbi:MAG: ABC transporter permease [Holophagae bacterium]|nr:ABC transporter permease [Holophagae bacterium]
MIRMAMRNLFRQRRRSILTLLTMMGGFVLGAFSIAWSDGTYNDVIRAFTGNRLGHIQIHQKGYSDRPSLYKTVDDADAIGEKLDSREHITGWAPRLYAYGLGSVAERSTAVRIIGIDPVRENRTTHFRNKLKEGAGFAGKTHHPAVLGAGLARQLRAKAGSELVIVSQGADGSIANDAYTVTGILDSGDPNADRMDCYLRLSDAQELMVLEGRVHEIAITVDRLSRVRSVTERLRGILADTGLSVEPWQEFAASFYRAMQADRKGNWITLAVILLIVAVGVLNTVLMSVLERRREYGVLLALGTRPGRLVRMVITEAVLLAAGSVIVGTVVGFFLNWWVSVRGIMLSEPFTYGGVTFTMLRTELNVPSFIIPACTVIATAILVALAPAWTASRTDPARSMRMH